MMMIHEPGKLKEVNKREKRNKKKKLRKAIRLGYTECDRTVGIWEAIYKKGSMPKA